MDPSSQTWSSSSYLEFLDGADIHPCQLSLASNYYPTFCGFDQTTVSEASSTTLNFSNSHQEGNTSFRKPYSSTPPFSSQLISFGNSSNSTISSPSSYQHTGMGSFVVKTESEKIDQMISFHSSETSPSFVIQEQTVKSTRTPQQAKYHVLAERKRREKLSRQFLSLSALVPGLKKMDKTSVIEGAISHMKHLEERLKVLEEEGKTEKPACFYYHYEENSPPLKKMEVRILKEDVLIKINCENPTGFTKETLTSEMKKLHLSVTKMKFLPFGDKMLAVSAIAKMKVQFCLGEEELANRIRQAITKLINVRRKHTN